MSQLPRHDDSQPRAGKMVDGFTWEGFLAAERDVERRYRNGLLDRATYDMHLRDFARKREQFFR
jgi:hypothetical protein